MTHSISAPKLNRRTLLTGVATTGLLAGCNLRAPAAPKSSMSSKNISVVDHWTNVMLDAVRSGSVPPPVAARAFAMGHTAGFVAVNAIDPTYTTPFMPNEGPAGANTDAAYATAAARAASHGLGTDLSGALSDYLLGNGHTDMRAIEFGTAVGNEIAANRKNDGAEMAGVSDTTRYPKVTTDMGWVPTAAGQEPLLPGWGKLRPWAVSNVGNFLPNTFPEQHSNEYARQLKKVKTIGGTTSSERTADQTQLAFFWEDGPGSVTPPGHWQTLAMGILGKRNLSTVEYARAMSLLSMAQADAAIVTWDCKYHFDILRPVTALNRKGLNWNTLIPSPPFPAYVSGHSVFSSASARMLAKVIGTDDIAFSGASPDPHLWPKHLNGAHRSWTSLSAAADEGGASREFGGVHWESDNTEGLRIGKQVADEVFRRAFSRA